MTDQLIHRGPDGRGTKVFEENDYWLGFGHRRLSIIDLSETGSQPMTYGDWTICFNGEIYNYQAIAKELLTTGKRFNKDSDTAVILAAFDTWGIECIHRFIGMFAFSIYNSRLHKAWIIRDRAGVKPLYLYQKDGLLLFGSELKSFHPHPKFVKRINPQALSTYFKTSYIPAPLCIFQDCEKVLPGEYLEIDLKTKQVNRVRYWNVFDLLDSKDPKQSPEDSLAQIEPLLKDACNLRMVSDVPVGVFLSGGYDSSLVTALIQKERTEPLKTFTIGFEFEEFNEMTHAKKVANHLGTDHYEYICSEKEAQEKITQIPHFFDEPFGDSSAIPTMLVSEMARKEVKVALSADAGDELFVGYTRYNSSIRLAKMIQRVPAGIRPLIGKMLSPFAADASQLNKVKEVLLSKNISSIPRIQTAFLNQQKLENLILDYEGYQENDLGGSSLNAISAAEYLRYLPDDIMAKVDRASMAVALEGREPLLDHRLAELVIPLPMDLKYKENSLKYILKEITHKYIPKEIMDRPKQGFGVPINHWMRSALKDIPQTYLSDDFVKNQGLFSVDYTRTARKQFLDGTIKDYSVWHLIAFQTWYEKWM